MDSGDYIFSRSFTGISIAATNTSWPSPASVAVFNWQYSMLFSPPFWEVAGGYSICFFLKSAVALIAKTPMNSNNNYLFPVDTQEAFPYTPPGQQPILYLDKREFCRMTTDR
jgi:hypothetical protein